ncbi:hypothetical protein MFMK1_003615 [Metallumcola ferriviriculae]|uniref:Uncharacterized protein n=1 Tax=Metallumcola ferriviriculae TaxID=3039180 RepID=A0AAU0UTP4_9FIRM|nr:hypothetical protein MFMK1_003615 [Desulfitibacteraceae bacterium MK1]
MRVLLLRLIIVALGCGAYTYYYIPYRKAVFTLNYEQMTSTFPVVTLVLILTGLLLELVPFNKGLNLAWGQLLLTILVMGAGILLVSPYGTKILGLDLKLWGTAMLAFPLVGILFGILVGKALIWEE